MSLIPNWRNRLPSIFGKSPSELFNWGSYLEDIEKEFSAMGFPHGLSVSSDDKNIYVEADVPGLTAKDVDVSIDDQNVLWIKGQRNVEEKDKAKKFYRRAAESFTYCVPLTDDVDASIEPKASCKNGVMKVTFQKKKEKAAPAKKISVKEEN